MHLFDEHGKIRKFESTEEILEYFYKFRIKYYGIRKSKMIEKIFYEFNEQQEVRRFMTLVMDEKIIVYRQKKEQIIAQIISNGFKKRNGSYQYLLEKRIYDFTEEELEKIDEKIKKLQQKLEFYKSSTEESLWLNDLEKIVM